MIRTVPAHVVSLLDRYQKDFASGSVKLFQRTCDLVIIEMESVCINVEALATDGLHPNLVWSTTKEGKYSYRALICALSSLSSSIR